MKNKNIQILDCTLRDGGYYNNWNFNKNLVETYMKSCIDSKIDIVEIGFRFSKEKIGLGPYAYSDEKLINNLEIPKNLKLSVMINASDFFGEKKITEELLNKLFVKKNFSKISLVRIAININDYLKGKNITKFVKSLGYKVGFNLMQANDKKMNYISKIASDITSWETVDYIYYADSIGSMDPKYISTITKCFKKYSKKIKIGIHAHNNKSLALINSLTAIDYGIDVVDSTMLGMGRGAGNTPTEALLLELENKGYNYHSDKLPGTIDLFLNLKNKYNWGPNYYYHFSAINNVHPTYIQKLLDDGKYNLDQKNLTMHKLKKRAANFFSEHTLRETIYKNKNNGLSNIYNLFNRKDVCILASGPTGNKFSNKIKKYIVDKKPVVISLNINQFLPKKFIDYYIFCYDYRVIYESHQFQNLQKSIIMPFTLFEKYLPKIDRKKIIDYGLVLKKNSLNAYSSYCEIESPLAIAYALAICSAGCAKSVNLAFVDGYDNNKLLNNEIIFYLKKFITKNVRTKIKFLTPSMLKNEI